jgi:hypothetical protein
MNKMLSRSPSEPMAPKGATGASTSREMTLVVGLRMSYCTASFHDEPTCGTPTPCEGTGVAKILPSISCLVYNCKIGFMTGSDVD